MIIPRKRGKKRTKNKKTSIDTHYGINGGLYWIINYYSESITLHTSAKISSSTP